MGIVDTVMTKVGQTLLDLEGRFGDREAAAPQEVLEDKVATARMATVVTALEALRQHQRDMTDAQAQMRNALVAEIQHLQKQVEELHEAAAMQSTLYVLQENVEVLKTKVDALLVIEGEKLRAVPSTPSTEEAERPITVPPEAK